MISIGFFLVVMLILLIGAGIGIWFALKFVKKKN